MSKVETKLKSMEEAANLEARKKRSMGMEIWRNFRKNTGAMIALGTLIAIALLAVTIDFWVDHDKITAINMAERLQWPSAKHWFGTDEMGRDLFWRVLYASRYSLAIGVVAVCVSCIIGISSLSQIVGLICHVVAIIANNLVWVGRARAAGCGRAGFESSARCDDSSSRFDMCTASLPVWGTIRSCERTATFP